VDKLEAQLHLIDLLVNNVAVIAQEARAFLAQQQQTQTQTQAQQQAAAATASPVAPVASPAPLPPGEGVWSHLDLVQSYLAALQRLYERSQSYVLAQDADTLWTELVQGAATRPVFARAVAFFRAAVAKDAKDSWLEQSEIAALLRRVPALPPHLVTKEVFWLTWTMFTMVGRGLAARPTREGRLGSRPWLSRRLLCSVVLWKNPLCSRCRPAARGVHFLPYSCCLPRPHGPRCTRTACTAKPPPTAMAGASCGC
jgi:hypothetical protein